MVDTNHPLAGQRVRFEVEVSAVRPASEEEIEKAQSELEERIEAASSAACCDHEHEEGHEHHDHEQEAHGPELVQLSKKTLS